MQIVMPVIARPDRGGALLKGTATFDVVEVSPDQITQIGSLKATNHQCYYEYDGKLWALWVNGTPQVTPVEDFASCKDAIALMRAGRHPLATKRPDTAFIEHPKMSFDRSRPDDPEIKATRVYRAMVAQASRAIICDGKFLTRTTGPVLAFSKAKNAAVAYTDLHDVYRYGSVMLNVFAMTEGRDFMARAIEQCGGRVVRREQGHWRGADPTPFSFDAMAYRIEHLAWAIAGELNGRRLDGATRDEVVAACDLNDVLSGRVPDREIGSNTEGAWPYERGDFEFADQSDIISVLRRIHARIEDISVGSGLADHLSYNLGRLAENEPIPDIDLDAIDMPPSAAPSDENEVDGAAEPGSDDGTEPVESRRSVRALFRKMFGRPR